MPTSDKQRQWFIKGKFLLLACLLLFIFIGAITFLICLDRYQNTTERLLKADRVTASLISLVLEERLRQIVKTMEAYANRPLLIRAARKKDVAGAREHLDSLTSNNPGIESIVITDKEATIWATSPRRPELIGKNTAYREWYKEIRKEWKPHITDAIVRIVAEKDLAIQIAVPIQDERGEVLGIIINSYRTIDLSKLIEEVSPDPGCSYNVVDRKGNLIYSNRLDYAKGLTPYPLFSVRNQIKSPNYQSVPIADPFHDGRTSHISYAPIELCGWSVFIGRDSRAILQNESNYFIRSAITALLLFLTITLMLGYFRKQVLLKQYEARILAEEELHRSEARYRSFIDVTGQLAWVTDSAGEVSEDIPSFRRFTGQTYEEVKGSGWAKALHLDDVDQAMSVWMDAVAGQKPYETEYRLRRHDGVYRHFLARGFPVLREDGNIGEWVGICIDITERKKAEKDLLFHKAILEETGQIAKVGGWSFDAITGEGFWTDEVARIHDLNPSIPTSRDSGLQYYTSESRPMIEAAIEMAVTQGTPYDLELEIISAKGVRKWVRTIGHPVYEYGRVARVHGSFQDITERKLAEVALRESEAKLREALKMSQMGNWSWDVQTGCVEWSEEVYRIFHLDPDKFTPRIDSILSLSPWPEDHERDQELIRKAMESYEKGEYEQRFLRPDGSIGYYYSTFQGKYDADGNLLSIVGTVQDITERKNLDNKLKESLADLQRSNKELEQFAYVASHDLQEPLRMVASYTQLLAERYQDKLDEKANLFIHYAVDGAVRMQSLINDLLIFSRFGTRGKPLEPVDANTLLKEAVANLKINIDETKAVISSGMLPEIRVDASQLVQLLQNLIGNAVKFRGEAQPLIHINAEDDGLQWLFSVRDNGIGIDPQFSDKVFDIFQRLHTKEEYPGSGIGLAICRKIVERHGGKIWFESQPGKGATFYFTIPK